MAPVWRRMITPVKSVSLLWALGDGRVRRAVEAAHHDAVADTITWLERHALFARVGDVGEYQVDTHGLIAAVFDHRESRLGDPDLHTHVAVANKVRAVVPGDEPGRERWLAIDGRTLYAAAVAASERYNTPAGGRRREPPRRALRCPGGHGAPRPTPGPRGRRRAGRADQGVLQAPR